MVARSRLGELDKLPDTKGQPKRETKNRKQCDRPKFSVDPDAGETWNNHLHCQGHQSIGPTDADGQDCAVIVRPILRRLVQPPPTAEKFGSAAIGPRMSVDLSPERSKPGAL